MQNLKNASCSKITINKNAITFKSYGYMLSLHGSWWVDVISCWIKINMRKWYFRVMKCIFDLLHREYIDAAWERIKSDQN